MIIGPKYKIARRLGAPIFEKTQTQKYVLSQSRRGKQDRPRQRSDYGMQLIEKQKARYTYLLTEKQFSNYVKKAGATKGNTVEKLYQLLESRLDNAIFRIGLAPTRMASKQMVSHGHITVNGKKVDIPSYNLSIGDKLAIRVGSQKKKLFETLDERLKDRTAPSWIKFDASKREAEIQGMPKMERADLLFDLNAVVEFYSR